MGDRFKIFNVKKEDNWKWGKKFKYLMCKKMEMETYLKYEMCKKCINGNRGHI